MRIFLGAIAALCLAALAQRAAAAPEQLFFSESFDTAERYLYEGLLEDRNFSYLDGEYEIDTTGSADYGQSVVLGDLSTYLVQVQARLTATDDDNGGGFGLAFNYREGAEYNDFLLFLVYHEGAFAVLRYQGGATTVIAPPKRTGLVRQLGMNTLAVDAADGAYRCLLNGEEVVRGTDGELTSGGVGLFGTARSVTRFDNLEVFADPPPAPLLDGFDGEIRLFDGAWQGVDFAYRDGMYVIDTTGAPDFGLAPFPGAAADFDFGADVTLLGGVLQGGYGLYARDYRDAAGQLNQLRFLISGDWFCVEQTVGGAFTTLAEWQKSETIRLDGPNRLQATLTGPELVFFINGVEVWRGSDAVPAAGEYGFIASQGIEVGFDNAAYLELR